MIFNKHFELRNKHARFSPSQHYWIKYDKKHFFDYLSSLEAKERGTRLHALAQAAIENRLPVARIKKTLNMYIIDCQKFNMHTEQPLYFSDNFFGTADAICYSERNNYLRIFDLKTGEHAASMDQLMIYAALFCLEYCEQLNVNPEDMKFELRIYQNNTIDAINPTGDEVKQFMDAIVAEDEWCQEYSEGAVL